MRSNVVRSRRTVCGGLVMCLVFRKRRALRESHAFEAICKKAIVTGGASGIGKAMSLPLPKKVLTSRFWILIRRTPKKRPRDCFCNR